MVAAYLHALRSSQRNVRILLSISAISGFTVDGGVYSVIFNLFLLRLNFGPTFVGQVNAVANLVFAFGSILGGWLGSRYGERRIMLIGMTIVVVGACGVPLTASVPVAWRGSWIMVSFVLLYLGLAQYFANSGPFLIRSVQTAARGDIFALQSAGNAIASFAGGLLGGLLPAFVAALLGVTLVNATPYQIPLVIVSLLTFVALGLLLQTRAEEASAADTIAAPAGAPAMTAAYGLIVFMAVVRFLQLGAMGASMTFFNVYMDTELGASTATIGLIAASARLLAVPAVLLGPALGRRIGYGTTAALTAGAAFASTLPLALAGTVAGAGAGFIGLLTSFSMRYPAFYVYLMGRTPDRLRPMMTGVNEMAAGLSVAFISLAGGYIIVQYGYAATFLTGGAMTLAGALLLYGYVRRKGE
jgi:MFS family permease